MLRPLTHGIVKNTGVVRRKENTSSTVLFWVVVRDAGTKELVRSHAYHDGREAEVECEFLREAPDPDGKDCLYPSKSS